MYTAELIFRITQGRPQIEKDAAVGIVMGALWENGQILDPGPPMTVTARRYRAFVSIPERTSLDAKQNSPAARKRLAALKRQGLARPEMKVLGKDRGQLDPCECSQPGNYILSTAWFDDRWTSPVQCGDCFLPVPLYRIPATQEPMMGNAPAGHWSLLQWEHYHRACEGFWLRSHPLMGKEDARTPERYAVRQLERIDSGLIKCGRRFCAMIEESTGRPTYYALTRLGDARSVRKEWLRPCPACGGAWLLDQPWHGRFCFRCEPCRLVSEIAGNAREHLRPKGNAKAQRGKGAEKQV